MRAGAVLAGLTCALVPVFATSGAVAPAGEAAKVAASPDSTYSADFKTVNAALIRYRNGEDSALEELRSAADRCARLYGRLDCPQIVSYFAAMSSADRRSGMESEKEFTRLYGEVSRARAGSDASSAWKARRPEVLDELEQIAVKSRSAPDCTPAARALALRATIHRERVVEDPEFDDSTRRTWIQEGVRDAEEALNLFKRSGYLTPRLDPLLELAWFDWTRGDWAAAEEGFEQVVDLARHVQQTDYVRWALTGLLRLAREAGDLREVSRLLDLLGDLDSPKLSWQLVASHASLLLALDEPRRAVEFIVRNKPAADDSLRDWHVLMETGLSRMGEIESAKAHEIVLRESLSNDAVARLAVAEACISRGDFKEALTLLLDAKLETRSTAALRATYERLLGTVQLALDHREDAVAAFERAFAICDSLEGRLGSGDRRAATSSLMGEVIGLETVAKLASARIDSGEALRAAACIEDRQSRAIRTSTGGREGSQIDERALREWAAAYEAGLVTWVIGADTTVVVHVSRSGEARGAVVKLGRRELEGGVRRLREVAIANDARTMQEYATELQAALFPEAIAGEIAQGTHRLLVCAHGPLERLPFELLPMFRGSDANALVPVVLPGLVEITPGAPLASHADLEWSLAGDPVDEHGNARLPGVRAELAELKSLHPDAVTRCGAEFDRAAFLEMLGSQRALHIATHLTSDRSKTSSIDTRLAHAAFELSRGVPIGIRDVLEARPRLPLAVLSACDSAGGDFVDGEAAIGVAKAFLESGTRNLLVTSWPVEDEAAKQFAVAFHRALEAGERPSQAAVTAREVLRASGARIADWAAFRLLGRD